MGILACYTVYMNSKCIIDGCPNDTSHHRAKRCTDHLNTCAVPNCPNPSRSVSGVMSSIWCSAHINRKPIEIRDTRVTRVDNLVNELSLYGDVTFTPFQTKGF